MILAIETATAACSVALMRDGRVIASAHEVLKRGHAERLIPMIAALPDGGRADQILVGCGPGSFTGIRVGLAAARGLAIAWAAEAHGFATLALIAAGYFREEDAAAEVFVAMDAGHGEVFVEGFTAQPFASVMPLMSVMPEHAAPLLRGKTVIGNAAARLAGAAQDVTVQAQEPDVRNLIALPAAFTRLPVRPIYGRGPDATLPA